MLCRWCLLLLAACLAGPATAQGLAEVIVRVADEGAGEVEAALRGEAGALRTTLLRESLGARPAFQQASRPPRARTEAPWRERVFLVTYPDSTAFEEALARWSATPGVAYAQPNGFFHLDAVREEPGGATSPGLLEEDLLAGEPFADSLDVLRVTRAVEAWARTTGDASVRIGLLDTGLMLDHPDLAAQVWRNPGEVPGNGLDDDGNGLADDVHGYDFVDRAVVLEEGDYRGRDPDVREDGTQDHGTLTAGVMSAALDGQGMAGTAPGCRVVVLRAFGRDGRAEDDDLAAALLYAADLGVEVVNLSFGRARPSPLLQEAVRYAHARGTVLVASGGNVGGDAPHYPSDYPEVIGVVWLADDGLGRASVAQHGPGIALGAPASSVLTTRLPRPDDSRPREAQLYSRVGGSSLAAPQVAGAAALLRSLDPTLSPEAVRAVLTATAHDIGAPGWDHDTGAGLLDVAAALGRPYPGLVEIERPSMDGGLSAARAAIVGSALAPRFVSYALDVAPGGPDDPAPDGRWIRVAGPFDRQVRRDTLAVWDTAPFAGGPYTLRLVVNTNDGGTLEARHRIVLDRTPPQVEVRYAGVAYDAGQAGLFVDVKADEPVKASLIVEEEGRVEGPDVQREHGLYVPNTTLAVSKLVGRLRVENAAGLVTELPVSAVMPPDERIPGRFTERAIDVPAGYLLPRLVDFDRDGLAEVVLNEARRPGALGDTVGVYEWTGQFETPFRLAARYEVPAIPRDVGDTDGDGRLELLFQVDPITLLVEASAVGAYPDTELYRNEDGTEPGGTPLWGARLTDLDGDGRGEILGLDLRSPRYQPLGEGETPEPTRWRVMERRGATFEEVARLGNPTDVSPPLDLNLFQRPYGLSGDFDGNGHAEWLTGDADGDLILYEVTGDDTYAVVWTHETDRFNAGQRMAQGDFDGDGLPEFAMFTTEFTAADVGMPTYGVLSLWDRAPGQPPTLLDRLVFVGDSRTDGALAASDLDGDGRAEVVVQHALQLWILDARGDTWQPVFHAGPDPTAEGPTGYASPQLVAGTLGPGRPGDILVSGLDGRLRWFAGAPQGVAAPRWVESIALNAEQVRLAWASDADSVRVFVADDAGPFDPVVTTTASEVVMPRTEPGRFALQAFREGEGSALSEAQRVRPHAPGTLTEIEVRAEGTLTMRFSEPLHPETGRDRFEVEGGEVAAVILDATGHEATVRVAPVPVGPRVLYWAGLRDVEGTPIHDGQAEVLFHDIEPLLHIAAVHILGVDRVRLAFSAPLDVELAEQPANYTLDPEGTVVAATPDTEDPRAVVLQVAGRVLGAVGRPTTVRVRGLRSASGAGLAPEGSVATLSAAETSLANVFVYPNPHRFGLHAEEVVVAGLPREASVQIYSTDGARVVVLEETDGDGGVLWDLRDSSGQRVPSGVYLVRVSSEGLGATLVKVAVQR